MSDEASRVDFDRDMRLVKFLEEHLGKTCRICNHDAIAHHDVPTPNSFGKSVSAQGDYWTYSPYKCLSADCPCRAPAHIMRQNLIRAALGLEEYRAI